MKRHWLASLAALAVVLVLVLGMVWLLADAPASRAPLDASATPATVQQTSPKLPPAAAVTSEQGQAAAQTSAREDAGLDKAAILSLREARINGDPRSPPMSAPASERDKPTAAELADPKLYAGYEKAQMLKAYQSYVNAVPKKVATLKNALDEAAQPGSGITPEQLAFARQKIADLEAMQKKLLADHPELKPPSVP